ncbi:hypothetical protein Egran_04298 [Elaphomyces granulatus]|uniref:DUF7703 domain-containing protein n=1 Tax=Elaphomyces granulatus TaxID=519963 RepID=A0A232LV76_9EURO|nr:hypothetical protein Egran_04298 [Elaphomyces granulatus]
MSGLHNITVPYVSTSQFDWSFARTYPLPWNQTIWSIVAVFSAVPLWMNIELTVWVLYVFRRYSGLYFWSILITTWCIALHAIGYVLKECVPDCNWILSTLIVEIGWVGMVTGFSMVLYSRLHLVNFTIKNPHILRITLIMIITDAFLFHTPTIVFQFGLANQSRHDQYASYLHVMERIQIMGFSLQEITLTSIYIYGTLQIIKSSLNSKIRTTMVFLILIQVMVMCCDISVIALDYANYYMLKAVVQSFYYALKLQLEFVILNKFRDVIANGGLTPGGLDVVEQQPKFDLSDSPSS